MNTLLTGVAGALAVIGVTTFTTPALATPVTPDGVYSATSVSSGSFDHAVWLVDLLGHTVADRYWQFEGGSGLFTVDGNSAELEGSIVQNTNPHNVLMIDMEFDFRGTGAAGQGSEAPKNGGGGDPDTWDYYDLVSGSITGTLMGEAVALDLTIRPSDELPAQLGLGANDKDGGFGFSSWIYWSVAAGNEFDFGRHSGIGDVNIQLAPVPLPAGGLLLLAGLGGLALARRARA